MDGSAPIDSSVNSATEPEPAHKTPHPPPAAPPAQSGPRGITHPNNEFTKPYRVINWYSRDSCWNDRAIRLDRRILSWCPRHAGTSRQFECARLITAAQVIQTFRRIA